MDSTAKPFKNHDRILTGLAAACFGAVVYGALLSLGF
jgi:hypothetical protein